MAHWISCCSRSAATNNPPACAPCANNTTTEASTTTPKPRLSGSSSLCTLQVMCQLLGLCCCIAHIRHGCQLLQLLPSGLRKVLQPSNKALQGRYTGAVQMSAGNNLSRNAELLAIIAYIVCIHSKHMSAIPGRHSCCIDARLAFPKRFPNVCIATKLPLVH